MNVATHMLRYNVFPQQHLENCHQLIFSHKLRATNSHYLKWLTHTKHTQLQYNKRLLPPLYADIFSNIRHPRSQLDPSPCSCSVFTVRERNAPLLRTTRGVNCGWYSFQANIERSCIPGAYVCMCVCECVWFRKGEVAISSISEDLVLAIKSIIHTSCLVF